MITHDDILFVIITAVLFFQGFYFARKQLLRIVIVSLIMLISDIVSINLYGMHTLSGDILVNIHELATVIIYVIFLWGFGYFVGHFVLIRENDIGKVKRMKLDEPKSWKLNWRKQ